MNENNNENEMQQEILPVQEEYKAPKKKCRCKIGKRTKKYIAFGLACALIGGLAGFGCSCLVKGGTSTVIEGKRENTVIQTVSVDTSKQMTAAEVYAANVKSTVGITTQVTTNYWGFQTTSAASGSGFVYSDDGYILTNYHVIEDASEISVTDYDGNSYDAKLVGFDESNDIAVLKVDAENLSPVVIGDSDNMNVGDGVVAIGNPLGELTFSLTTGVVSALDREVTLSSGTTMALIQTDCAINSGNSGGALFNLYGEVVGITNAKYSSSSSTEASIDNIGFAIPINTVKSIVDSIIEKGYIAKPFIGVSVADVSEESQGYGLPQGASVQKVTEDSPAKKAGLQVNDIITAVDGKEITGKSELAEIIAKCEVGDKLKLTVYRQGDTVSVTVTVGENVTSALTETDDDDEQSQLQQFAQQFGEQYGEQQMPFGFGN